MNYLEDLRNIHSLSQTEKEKIIKKTIPIFEKKLEQLQEYADSLGHDDPIGFRQHRAAELQVQIRNLDLFIRSFHCQLTGETDDVLEQVAQSMCSYTKETDPAKYIQFGSEQPDTMLNLIGDVLTNLFSKN